MASALDWLKDQDNVNSIVLLHGDRNAMQVLAMWENIEIPFTDFDFDDDYDKSKMLDDLWSHRAVDIAIRKMREMSQMSERELRESVHMLRRARMIYPDGTIAKIAKGYLQRNVKMILEGNA